MSDTNAAPEAAAASGPLSADAGGTGAVLEMGVATLDLGGVSAQAGAGSVTPPTALWNGPVNADGSPAPLGSASLSAVPSAPPNVDPAAVQPVTTSQSPAGTAPDAAAETAGAPGAGEEVDVMPEVIAVVNAIEQLAIFWGGETGVKIRNHTGRLRELLQA